MVVGGGVALNRSCAYWPSAVSDQSGAEVFYPTFQSLHRTDNGAMIALVGRYVCDGAVDDYAFTVRPRWELADLSTPS